VEIRTHWDAGHFLIEPVDSHLQIAQLKAEFGFLSVEEYRALHAAAYRQIHAGKPPQPQATAHGDRPMFSKGKG
jgi:hypothetical protein